jgi:carbon-monoxide dehydrogenase small subunit
MTTLSLKINGRPVTAAIEPRTLLVDFLRDSQGLTGTHVGCDTSQCGACIVLVDGRSMKSCSLLALQVHGREVTTIEGVAPSGDAGGRSLHPLQEAFRRHHALQCGFCTPGMILSALDLLSRHADPGEALIRTWLAGNLCRCTGYINIVRAIRSVASGRGADAPD